MYAMDIMDAYRCLPVMKDLKMGDGAIYSNKCTFRSISWVQIRT